RVALPHRVLGVRRVVAQADAAGDGEEPRVDCLRADHRTEDGARLLDAVDVAFPGYRVELRVRLQVVTAHGNPVDPDPEVCCDARSLHVEADVAGAEEAHRVAKNVLGGDLQGEGSGEGVLDLDVDLAVEEVEGVPADRPFVLRVLSLGRGRRLCRRRRIRG